MAFGSTLAREEAFADHVWHERAAGGASGGDRATFIAEDDGRWIGLATGLPDDLDDPGAKGPVLVGMFVEPGERRRHIAVALVEAVTGWARTQHAPQISLWVTSTNTPAIALYDRCGFRPTGEVRPVGHTPALTELRMVRTLV
ncbi:MAG TPA: GNAT family N-acetyltransferase [Candidatus Methylomirabilis sp.]|nr:GNAT family N-acetyltransferase [Candidatus Methylomirabilis sp.]